jgi:hypothetical protein
LLLGFIPSTPPKNVQTSPKTPLKSSLCLRTLKNSL